MDIEGTASLVTFGDTSGFEVAVEDPDQTRRYVKDQRVARQAGRDRLAFRPGVPLECSEFVGVPGLEILSQIATDHHAISLSALLIGRVEVNTREIAVEPQLSNGQRT